LESKLKENEIIVKTLEKDWHAVRHGRKFEWSKSMFRFELLRKLVLTNQRVVFLKEGEIDHEIPLENIREVILDSIGTGNPYLRMELKNGDAVSIFFPCVGMKMFLGAFYLIGKQRRLTKEWADAINNQIRS